METRRISLSRLSVGIKACLLVAGSFTFLTPDARAVTIIFQGGESGELQYLSDGVTEISTDAGFFFEMGAFTDGFVPTDQNTDEWLDHWVLVNDDEGESLEDARTPFRVVSSIFPDYGGFTSSIEFENNNAPFSINTQGYIWGFDNRTEAGDSEWILLTNADEWRFPDSSNQQLVTQVWSVGTSSEVVVGSVTGASMTLGSVTVASLASPIPELSSTSLLAFGSLTLLVARRRRPGIAASGAPLLS